MLVNFAPVFPTFPCAGNDFGDGVPVEAQQLAVADPASAHRCAGAKFRRATQHSHCSPSSAGCHTLRPKGPAIPVLAAYFKDPSTGWIKRCFTL